MGRQSEGVVGEAKGRPEVPYLWVLLEGCSGHCQGFWGPEKPTVYLKWEKAAVWSGQEMKDTQDVGMCVCNRGKPYAEEADDLGQSRK